DRLVLDQHGTRTTLGSVAHALGACDVEAVTQGVEQGHARLKLELRLLAVDHQFDRNLAGTIYGHLFARRQHSGWTSNQWDCDRDAGNFQEVTPGNTGKLIRFLGIVVRHPYPPRS